MQIILKQEVDNLGDAGDVVQVKAGYGRNYLIPQGFAVPANVRNVAVLEHQKRVAEDLRRKQIGTAKEVAASIAEVSISLRREAGEDSKIFGSVTTRDIAEALAEHEIKIDRKSVVLAEPIRALGLFTVQVRLHRDVTADLRVFVIAA